MKVLVLGGAGAMGRRTVADLATDSAVSRITVADRNAPAAQALAERLGGVVSPLTLDARDHDAVVRVMREHDVVASALGPFFVFERSMVAAALEADVDYISICDEWDVVVDIIERFDQPARLAGRKIVTGVGASPGISNIAAAHLIDRLRADGDTARSVAITVYIPLDAGCGPAAIRHGLHIMSGKTQAWLGGQAVFPPACSVSRVVAFGHAGKKRVWNMGHSEPVTLPRSFPELEAVDFSMGYGLGSRMLVWPAKMGLFEWAPSARILNGLYCGLERLIAGEHRPCVVRVDVHGERGSLRAIGAGTMTDGTGLALSIGARMLGRGALSSGTAGGVLAPEACFDAGAFLDELAVKGMRVRVEF